MFITLEGIEGSGKTTQVEKIVAICKAKGYECVTTREPGGTAIGAQIRAVLLDPDNEELVPEAELLLYVADRVQHLRTVIQPNLAAGRVVVCDRFFDATMVYQGYARGLDKEMIRTLHRLTCNDAQPDVTLLFDLEPETGLARAWRQIDNGGRTDAETRFEKEKMAFHRKVREGYVDLARLAPDRFHIVDASRPIADVTRAVAQILTPLLSKQQQ